MKFRCEKETLANAFATAARAAGNKGGFQLILTGLHLRLEGDKLTITGTDRELQITCSVVVNGQGDGTTVLPARLASDVIRSLDDGAVDVELEEHMIQINSSRSNFKLNAMSATDFPVVEAVDGSSAVLKSDKLLSAIRQVANAASSDDSRPVLTGTLLAADDNSLRLVTTDSYRLALCELEDAKILDSGTSVLVPTRTLQEVSRLLENAEDAFLSFTNQDAVFIIGDVTVKTRLIEGDFPNYKGLIPEQHQNKLIVNRDLLLNAVRRIKLLAQDSTPIKLNMSTTNFELSASTQDVGVAQESVEASYNGEDLVVAFNPDYFKIGVQAAPGDEIVLHTADALKPAVIRSPVSEDYLYLIMPVRVT